MDIRTNDIYRAIVEQCKTDIAEADVESQARLFVEFVDFVLANAASEGAAAVKNLLDAGEIAPWDEQWVVEELGRATLDALTSWQTVAVAVLERLEKAGESEAILELRLRLAEACERRTAVA
jgi:hypothetical protein